MMVITGDHQAAGGRGRVERFRYRDQRDATLLEEFQQTAEVLDGPREPVEFGNHRLDFAAVPLGGFSPFVSSNPFFQHNLRGAGTRGAQQFRQILRPCDGSCDSDSGVASGSGGP
jgi:hypothetical protein